MYKKIVILACFLLVTLLIVSFLAKTQSLQAAADHVVISEVQIVGESSGEDFIELYNPTSAQVDLSNYRLVKRTSTGDTDDSIVAFTEGDVIEAHGFFLWCNNDIAVSFGCDQNTSGTISSNNSVGLRDGALDTGILKDSLTFGTVANPLGEGTAIDPAPGASQSAERKANSSSNISSMEPGGVDEFSGNGEDTDNNNSDFIIRSVSDPQNSSSLKEPQEITPSPTPTDTPTPTPTEELSPTPTEEPTPSPSPTLEPSPSPTITPSPTPQGKVIAKFSFPGKITVCRLNYKIIKFGFIHFSFPYIYCK